MRVRMQESGFSMVELMVVVGILSVVAVGTSMQLVNIVNDGIKGNSRANMIQTEGLIQKAFEKKKSTTAQTCAQTLSFVNGFNRNAGSQNDVRLNLGGQTLDAGTNSKVSGTNEFRISKLYLGDTLSLAPERPGSFLTTLYMTADYGILGNLTKSKPRQIATVVLTLGSTGNLLDCNVSTSTPTAQQTCNGLYGMSWTSSTGRCDQALVMDNDYNFTACPPGTKSQEGICLPTASGCANGQIARGFNLGIADNCAEPPLNPAVGRPSLGIPPPVEGQANATPQPDPNPGPTIAPITNTPITGGPATTAPSTCTGYNTVGASTYDACAAIDSCKRAMDAQNIQRAPTNCTSTVTIAYSTPAPAATPSLAPPNDGSCACSDARIPNGGRCGLCVPNANLGYGYANRNYVINKCVNGNLQPDGNATMDFDTCESSWAPLRQTSYGYRQYGGYRYDIP